MVYKCCAPNCHSGYETKIGKNNEIVSIFKFPGHDKDPEKRALWIARVPRKGCKPDNTKCILSMKCKSGHTQEKSIRRIAFTAFNVCSKNMVSEIRDKFNVSKKRAGDSKNSKISKSERKMKKLQGNYFLAYLFCTFTLTFFISRSSFEI